MSKSMSRIQEELLEAYTEMLGDDAIPSLSALDQDVDMLLFQDDEPLTLADIQSCY